MRTRATTSENAAKRAAVMTTVNMNSVRRIAIVHLSAMGDCILLQSTVLRILDHFLGIQVDWYIDKDLVGVASFLGIKKPARGRLFYWKEGTT